ncbi:heparinase II/III domain-containing protein [Streptomyces sp. NPDC055109]
MIARTGWDEGPTAETAITQVNIGGYQFNNHQHLDAGAFQIYYLGALALDSGIYESKEGSYGTKHDVNYHKRTIAHNALVIKNPKETFNWYNDKISNDGGQRFPADAAEPNTLTDILNADRHHKNARSASGWAGPDRQSPVFSHIKGNITPGYGSKARLVNRSFVFINLNQSGHPGALIVRDSITTSDASFDTAFLLHSAEKPIVSGTQVTIARTDNGATGRLHMTTLAPADPRITSIGGPGHEFEVDGVNYPSTPRDNTVVDPGAWRIEVAPSKQHASTEFLNVLQPHAADAKPYAVLSTQTAGAFLVRIHNTLTIFSNSSSNLRRPIEFTITDEAGERTEFLATDLPRTGWRLKRRGSRSPVRGQIRRGSTLYASLAPGTYRLSR